MSVAAHRQFIVFTGGNDRAVLAFLRALRLCGERAHVVARTADDRVLRTSFRRDVRWIRPTHALSLDVAREAIARVREAAGDSPLVVLPSTEYLNLFLLEHRSQIEGMGCAVPLVGRDLYALLTGKRTAADFFAANGIACPRELDPCRHPAVPLVAKPRCNVARSGESLYPHLLESREQLAGFLRDHDSSDYFFQEFVRGDSLYLLFHLGRDGHDVLWSQRNLLQQPDGKSMLLAEASDFHHSATAARMVEALRAKGFHGLGMIEVLRSGDRDVFIEMNPRIWGPAQFCIDQHQPLLQAFIGESLYDHPARFLACNAGRRRRRYLWSGGILETLRAGRRPVWHASPGRLWHAAVGNLASDVYLRKDSWRSFLHDLLRPVPAGHEP